MEGHQPFSRDIQAFGAYRYTRDQRYSTVTANARYTEMIAGAADFQGRRVVDVGAGDGTYTAELRRRTTAASITGVEPAAGAAELAGRQFQADGLAFIAGDSAGLLAEGREFDIAVYRGVIHHVDDPSAEIRRAFLLAARVIILEPNGRNPLMKIVENVSPYHRRHRERSFAPPRWRPGSAKRGAR